MGIVILIAFLSCAKDDEWWVEKNVFSEDKMVVAQYANNGKAHQSAAAYGDYAFFVTNRRSALYCYNLKTKSLILQKKIYPRK